MPLVALALLLVLPVLAVLLMPLTLFLRFRAGSARRRARGWLASVNVVALSLSTALFALGAGISSVWIPGSFTYALAGVAAGAVLGGFGVVLSRWEPDHGVLHYTPNRWLVLTITLVVAARIAYGLLRAWQAWHSGTSDWLEAAGIAGSLAAGGLVLGYHLVYWRGVSRRLRAVREARFGG